MDTKSTLPTLDAVNFTGVVSEDIPIYWDRLEELVEKPLKRTGADKRYTPSDVLWKCINKEWQCWIAWSTDIDCAFFTYISEYPTEYREFSIYLVGGSRINEWLPIAWETFKEYAKANDCKAIVGYGRKGWLRKLKEVEDGDFEQHLAFSVKV